MVRRIEDISDKRIGTQGEPIADGEHNALCWMVADRL